MEAEYYRLKKLYSDEMTIRKNMPKENLVIDNLPPIIKRKLETSAESLIFSPDGVAKQLGHHPGMAASEYIGVLSKIKDCTGDFIYSVEDCKTILLVHNGNWYRVALKTTNDRKEAFIVSMFRLRDKDYEREIAIIKALKKATAKQ
jgi:hypothetical protein